jgi:hypothetical protein
MKLIATLAAALTLTACATGNDAYYAAIAEREKRQAEQELRADTAIAQMASGGDAQAKGMAIMYFAQKASGAKANQQAIAAPKSTAEAILPWASLIIPSLTQLYTIQQSTSVQLRQSNNALAGKKDDNDMITDLVHGRVTPIVGTKDDVLLYPN